MITKTYLKHEFLHTYLFDSSDSSDRSDSSEKEKKKLEEEEKNYEKEKKKKTYSPSWEGNVLLYVTVYYLGQILDVLCIKQYWKS